MIENIIKCCSLLLAVSYAADHPLWGQAYPSTSEFRFGIAYGAGKDNLDADVAKRMGEIGVGLARGHVNWSRVQPKADQWRWEHADQIIDAHQAAGIEVQLLLSGAPGWSWRPGYRVTEHVGGGTIPPRDEPWRAWCRALATRYKGRVRFYEIWNEPDIGFWAGTVDEYMQLLKAASEEIRAANPDAVILTGGFAAMSHKESKPGMIRRVLSEGRDWFDRIAYHRHGHFDEFAREIDNYLIPLQKATGTLDKPLHFSETAMDTRNGQHYQAETLVKKIAFSKARGALAYTWFNFHDFNQDGAPPNQPGTTYGLFTIDGKQKLAYQAYGVLIKQIAKAVPLKPYAIGEGHWAFPFRGPNQRIVVVVWTEDADDADSGPLLTFATRANSVRVVDVLGDQRRLPIHDGLVAYGMTSSPVYLIFEGEAEPAPKLRNVAAKLVCQPTDDALTEEVTFNLSNPLDRSVRVKLDWKIPSPLTVDDVIPESQTIPAGETVVIRFPVTAAESSDFNYPKQTTITVSYTFDQTGWNGKQAATVRARPITLSREPIPNSFEQYQLLLGEPFQVERLAEHDPNSVHMVWQGWHDLHSKVWFSRRAHGLDVRVLRKDADRCTGDTTILILTFPDGGTRTLSIPGDGQSTTATWDDGDQTMIPVKHGGSGDIRLASVVLPDSISRISNAILQRGVRVSVTAEDDDGGGIETRIHLLGPNSPHTQLPVLLLNAAD